MVAQRKTYTPRNEWPKEYQPITRESGFFNKKESEGRRGKRSLEAMVADLDSPIEQAAYAVERIEKIELNIKKILDSISIRAKALVIQRKPSLRKYI
jgi:hypothetical protein